MKYPRDYPVYRAAGMLLSGALAGISIGMIYLLWKEIAPAMTAVDPGAAITTAIKGVIEDYFEPIVAVVLLTAITAPICFCVLFYDRRVIERVRRGLCARCGYQLDRRDTKCPECNEQRL